MARAVIFMKKAAEMENTPEELKNFSFLFLLTHSKYIALLYDRAGVPLWAANQNTHSHKTILDRLMTGSLFKFYDVPETRDLNTLFDKSTGKTEKPAAELDVLALESVTFDRYPSFPSKNVAELESLAPFFTINTPMTLLSLIKLNPSRFIGIISFPEIINTLAAADNKSTVLVNEKGEILGANSLFIKPLGLSDPKLLLGKPLKEVLSFNRPAFAASEEPSPAPYTDTETWAFPDKGPPLSLVSEAFCAPEREKEGVRYANTSAYDTAYLAWHRPLVVDNHDFEIRILFRSAREPIPRLLVRGVKYASNASPDITGYAVSSAASGSCALKKNTNYVHTFFVPRADDERDHLFILAKTRDRFTLNLDGTRLCQWTETVPFLLDTDNLFYLFLKPGESFLFKSITVSSRPSGTRRGDRLPPLRARLKGVKDVHEYNAHVDQRAVNFHEGNRNITLYQFEDITDLKQDIDTLQQERDQLRHLLIREKAFIGKSPAVLAIREQLPTVADSNLSVLIQGETGTGKEVLAQAIHNMSPRKDRPFIKIDCLSIPETLIESELFGHEKGAFTGAVASYAGRFEQAQGGTLFLDEIGNLPLSVQAKLLSVLQDRKIQRVGAAQSIPLDFRLIAASNMPLTQMIARGKFRQDLFYRLNQLLIPLPPLRERREDIPLLAEHFLGEANQAYRKNVERISPPAVETLYKAAWPGNIREFKNVILKGVLFCKGTVLEKKHLAVADAAPSSPGGGGAREKCVYKKTDLEKAFRENRGNVKLASRSLQLSRNMIYI